MKVVLLIQARVNSSRLPGKVLLQLEGKSVLEHVVERAGRCARVSDVIICTSTSCDDDAVAALCSSLPVKCFRGSEHDVLDRFYQAAWLSSADIVVRCTCDCPMIDAGLIDKVINHFRQNDLDYMCLGDNNYQCDGFDVEVFSFKALALASREARESYEREHVTPFVRKTGKCASLPLQGLERYQNLRFQDLRFSLDTERDFERIKTVFAALYQKNNNFSLFDVLDFADANCEVVRSVDESGLVFTGKGQTLYEQAKMLIPGGTQLLSKRPEMLLPDLWPAYYRTAQGIDITTLDGVKLKDFGYMSVGACVLGYCDYDVNSAVHRAINRGSISSLNCPSEVELTKLLCEIHPWAECARYTRGSGEACALAVRIARAASGKDKLAFCGYHGWHDWYLAANINDGNNDLLKFHLLPNLNMQGVPSGLKNSAFPFSYNKIEELLQIVTSHDIGCIIMEVQRSEPPKDGFLKKVRDLASEKGIILIFDEVTSGFRHNAGGLHLLLGVNPDVAILGKALGNGFPIAAVIGTRAVMNAAANTFISSTYWTEDIGPSAALACIKKFRDNHVGQHLEQLGKYFQTELRRIAKDTEIDVSVDGLAALSTFTFKYENKQAVKTLFMQKMLERKILSGGGFYISFAHKKADVDFYLNQIRLVFTEMSVAIKENTVEKSLLGPEAHSGMARLS